MLRIDSRSLVIAVVLGMLALCPVVRADDAPPVGSRVLVSIQTGEAFLGKVVSVDDAAVVIDHATLGRLQFPRAQVLSMSARPEPAPPPAPVAPAVPADAPAAPSEPAAKETPAVTILPPPPPPPAPDPTSFWDGWKGQIDFGLNGADGNSESLSLRGGLTLKRETSQSITTFAANYNYATSDGDTTTDQGEASIRYDWRFSPPWRLYAIAKAEYDTFQDWDWRISAFTGLGYEFINNDTTLLLGRVGIGASKEIGSDNNRIEPELDLGLDFEHKIDERQKVFFTIDYYPSLHNFSDYRAVAKAGYEIVVDPENNLSLKLGVEDRYDATPGDDKKRNDILYFATLSYSF